MIDVILYAEDFEEVLNEASSLDERINDGWMQMIGDDNYQTLINLFSRANYYDSFEEVDLLREETLKRYKKILTGKDRVRLIEFAFDLGQLVGRAEQLLRDRSD